MPKTSVVLFAADASTAPRSVSMKRSAKKTDAVDILHRRYIQNNPKREMSLQEERVNAEVARMIYNARMEAGLSQKQMAEMVGTTQSVISRMEDADYSGHSLTLLTRIAKALNRRITVKMTVEGRA